MSVEYWLNRKWEAPRNFQCFHCGNIFGRFLGRGITCCPECHRADWNIKPAPYCVHTMTMIDTILAFMEGKDYDK